MRTPGPAQGRRGAPGTAQQSPAGCGGAAGGHAPQLGPPLSVSSLCLSPLGGGRLTKGALTLPGGDRTVVNYYSFPPDSLCISHSGRIINSNRLSLTLSIAPHLCPPEEIIFPEALHVSLIKNPKAKEIFLFYVLCPPQGIPLPLLLQKLTGDLPRSVLHKHALTGPQWKIPAGNGFLEGGGGAKLRPHRGSLPLYPFRRWRQRSDLG